MSTQPLTAIAQQEVGKLLHAGDLAVDATIGNGHDCLFLARSVAPGGRVIGFDVQTAALDAARSRLDEAGLAGLVDLYHRGHEHMADTVPTTWRGRLAAVMFNLGYLPGGDKAVITHASTTLPALRQGFALLRTGGLLTVMLYRGHSGADDEVSAVSDWIAGMERQCAVEVHESPGPLLYLLWRT